MKKKIACAIAVVLIFCLLLFGGFFYRQYENEAKVKEALAIKQETMRDMVEPYANLSYANKFIGDTSLSKMTKEKISGILQQEWDKFTNRQVVIRINKKEYNYDLSSFKVKPYFLTSDGKSFTDVDELAEYVVSLEKDADLETQYAIVCGNRQPKTLHIELCQDYSEARVTSVLETLYKLHYSEGSNAAFAKGLKLVKSTNGTKLLLKPLEKKLNRYLSSLKAESLEIVCHTATVKPEWTTAKLKQCENVIGEFSTTFTATGNRGNNVKLGASRVNGIFLYPGEQVSFDELLHDDSDGQHFLEAPSYLNGQSVMTAGGGICQVSSTCYNAILRAGILPVKRFNHSMSVSYVPMGLDATISEGVKDMVVENKLDYPMYLEATVIGGTLRVRIYSDKRAKGGYTYVPRAVQLSSLRAAAYLDKYKDGKLIESIYMHTDTYLPHA